MPISLVIIIFSYVCHSVLPNVEASMANKSQFRTLLKLTFVFVAVLKLGFSVCVFLSFSSNIQELIVNSLPMGNMRRFVNGLLILNAFFSYPFLVISIIQISEESVSPDSISFKIPDLVWFIGIRVITNFIALLPAYCHSSFRPVYGVHWQPNRILHCLHFSRLFSSHAKSERFKTASLYFGYSDYHLRDSCQHTGFSFHWQILY